MDTSASTTDADGGFKEHIRTRLRNQLTDLLFDLLSEDTENHTCLNSDPDVAFERCYEVACDVVNDIV